MPKFSADFIFTSNAGPIKNGLVVLDDSGLVLDVLEPADINFPSGGYERCEGIICPGFINTHCHLELSFLKGKIAKSTGLPDFLRAVTSLREAGVEEILESIEAAELEMMESGTVAVGDISNGTHTFRQKAKSKINYYTFFELIGFSPGNADAIYQKGLGLMQEYLGLEAEFPGFRASASIVPHAPYTVSGRLLKLIGSQCYEDGGIISIHNQENEDENLLYLSGSGKFRELLHSFSIDTSHWKPSGFNSLPSVLAQLPKCNKILLVHNTFTTEKDVDWANGYSNQIWWCLCPKANLYIENRLPDINMFYKKGLNITIGTDSLSSNDTLSVLEELKTIRKHFPAIPLQEKLKWATKNGASLLGFKELGTIEKGKKPGINLIQGVDLEEMALTEASIVKRLV